MNYAKIKKTDIANGPGVRVSLFVSGCRNHCPGCFNQETWDFGYGKEFTKDVANDILEGCSPDYIRGMSVLGGEPFEPENIIELVPFLRRFHELYPDKTIWCYTGFVFEDLLKCVKGRIISKRYGDPEVIQNLLWEIDILVDGPFVYDLKDPRLAFRGSSNQRIIDMKQSLTQQKTIYWEGYIDG